MRKRLSIENFIDREEYKNLSLTVWQLSGLHIWIADLNSRSIIFPSRRLPEHNQPFPCTLIQQSHEGQRRCYSSDCQGIREAIKTKKPYIYQCHAGLTEFVIPLYLFDLPLGYILSGQCLVPSRNPLEFSEIKKNFTDLPIHKKTMERAFKNLVVISEEKLTSLIYFILRSVHYLIRLKGEKLSKGEWKDFRRLKIETFLHENFQDGITLEALAKQIGITSKYCSELFKKEFNTNFVSYLTQLRMERAKDLLLSSSLSILQIALEVGYESLGAFNKAFKKYFNLNPTSYRERWLASAPSRPNLRIRETGQAK